MRRRKATFWIWTLLSLPFLIIGFRFAGDTLTYGQVLHQTGWLSAALLIAALSVTPLRSLPGSQRWFMSIAPHRRALGVASFAYAALHTGVYLERKWGADLIVREGLEAPLATGWLAFVLFSALAITSNNTSVRLMGRRWKQLHRGVYLATALVFVHWWLASFDPSMGFLFLGVLLVMQIPRLVERLRRS